MPRRTTRTILLAGALLLAAAPAAAQTIIGRLVNQATGEPVDGAFVVLVDTAGAEHGGVLTNDDGRFFARAPGPGTYRLKVERIGFATRFSEPIGVAAGETVAHTMSLSFEAIALAAIRVEGEQRCRVRPGEGERTAEVWEEARKALRLAAWTQEQEAVRFRAVQYERVLDPAGRVLSEQRRSRTGYNRGSPFRSVPAEELAREGYVVREPDGSWVYRAPDAEVLLSESFLDTHCFELREGEEEALIGLAFRPVDARGPADIRGTMWLDRETAELRRLEFDYTELPFPVDAAGLGGAIEFDRVRGGPWIVRDWSIRMPEDVAMVHENMPNMGINRTRYEIRSIKEAGGEVYDVVDAAGASLEEAEGGAITGVVYDSAGFVALAGVRVTVVGANVEVRTGRDGRFRVDGLMGGVYGIALTPRHWAYPWPAPERTEVEVPEDGVTQVRLTLPSDDDLAEAWCPAAPDSLPGVVVGRVTRATGAPAPRARVMLAWSELHIARNWASIRQEELGTEAVAGPDGWFRACGVPVRGAVRLTAMEPDGDADRAMRRLRRARRSGSERGVATVRFGEDRLLRQDLVLTP